MVINKNTKFQMNSQFELGFVTDFKRKRMKIFSVKKKKLNVSKFKQLV